MATNSGKIKPGKTTLSKGKYVSRAVFAKMQAEKQRLYHDIKLMVSGGAEGGVIWKKWRKHFKQKNWVTEILRQAAKEQLPKYKTKD